MELTLDQYEKDTLLETIKFRIEEDEHLLVNTSLKHDLIDILDKLQYEEYWNGNSRSWSQHYDSDITCCSIDCDLSDPYVWRLNNSTILIAWFDL